MDVHTRLHGPLDEATADAIYRECRRLGTTLQVPGAHVAGRPGRVRGYWDCRRGRTSGSIRRSATTCDRLIMLDYLPRPFGTALGPVNRFLTTGFLPPPFREQMQLPWTERDQRQFDLLIRMVASVYRLLPAPVGAVPVQRQPAGTAAADDARPPHEARTDRDTPVRSGDKNLLIPNGPVGLFRRDAARRPGCLAAGLRPRPGPGRRRPRGDVPGDAAAAGYGDAGWTPCLDPAGQTGRFAWKIRPAWRIGAVLGYQDYRASRIFRDLLRAGGRAGQGCGEIELKWRK